MVIKIKIIFIVFHSYAHKHFVQWVSGHNVTDVVSLVDYGVERGHWMHLKPEHSIGCTEIWYEILWHVSLLKWNKKIDVVIMLLSKFPRYFYDLCFCCGQVGSGCNWNQSSDDEIAKQNLYHWNPWTNVLNLINLFDSARQIDLWSNSKCIRDTGVQYLFKINGAWSTYGSGILTLKQMCEECITCLID